MKRFWDKVEKTPTCWLWLARLNRGYGQFRLGSRQRSAHVVAWEMEHGPVPAGLELDHLCRVPRCVRPDHMEPVTRKVNLNRGVNANTRKTHCPYGHEFTSENTYVWSNGARHCRACNRHYSLTYKQRTRGAQ